jgi:hypothetical protein
VDVGCNPAFSPAFCHEVEEVFGGVEGVFSRGCVRYAIDLQLCKRR